MRKYQAIGDLIYFISKEFKTNIDEKLKNRNLGQGQTLILMTLLRLENTGEINQDILAKEMGINKANTSRNLTKLKQNGFIEINADTKDNRKKNISLTSKAYNEIINIEKTLKEIYIDMIEGLDERELFCTMKTLEKIKNNLYNK